ncbi:hypothetical protein Tco_1014968 [Tanacetum coccineum]
MEDVLATLNSMELKKRTEGTTEVTGDGLYVRERSDHSSKAHSGGSSRFKSRGGTEALVAVENDEMTNLVMDSGGSYHMTHMRDFLYNFKGFNGGSVQLELRRSLISLGTLKKEGYIVKMQMGRIKVIKGCRVMMTGIRKKHRVYTLEAKLMTFGVQKHGGSKQVGLKQFGSKQLGFKQLGHKQVGFKRLGPSVKT